jgi:hypothetical protein
MAEFVRQCWNSYAIVLVFCPDTGGYTIVSNVLHGWDEFPKVGLIVEGKKKTVSSKIVPMSFRQGSKAMSG